MSEEIGNELDEQLDLAGEGLMAPDEMDLAQDREDREAGESQTETAQAEETEASFLTEKFVYTKPDGSEVELTGQELLEARDRLEALQAENEALKSKPPEQKAEEKPQQVQEGADIHPVDWSKTGDLLAERLLGPDFENMSVDERARLGEIGPMMNDAFHRTVLTSQVIGTAIRNTIREELQNIQAGQQKETSFKEFVGSKVSEDEIKAFQQSNAWASTRELAIAGVQLAKERQEIADLKAGKGKQVTEAEKRGKEAGAQETIRHLKASGRLRRVAGSGQGGAQPTNQGAKPLTEGQRVSAWASKAKELGAT